MWQRFEQRWQCQHTCLASDRALGIEPASFPFFFACPLRQHRRLRRVVEPLGPRPLPLTPAKTRYFSRDSYSDAISICFLRASFSLLFFLSCVERYYHPWRKIYFDLERVWDRSVETRINHRSNLMVDLWRERILMSITHTKVWVNNSSMERLWVIYILHMKCNFWRNKCICFKITTGMEDIKLNF